MYIDFYLGGYINNAIGDEDRIPLYTYFAYIILLGVKY